MQANAAVGMAVFKRMLDAGRPDTVRRLNIDQYTGWEQRMLDL
jgi:hypothetical protein